MRPPEFTGGNDRLVSLEERIEALASMRPPEFTGGNGSEAGPAVSLLIELQ